MPQRMTLSQIFPSIIGKQGGKLTSILSSTSLKYYGPTLLLITSILYPYSGEVSFTGSSMNRRKNTCYSQLNVSLPVVGLDQSGASTVCVGSTHPTFKNSRLKVTLGSYISHFKILVSNFFFFR